MIITPEPSSNGGTVRYTPAQDFAPRIAAMRARLAASGIVIPPSSRFEAFARRSRRFALGQIRVDSPDRAEVVALGEGARFFAELEMVTAEFLPTSDPTIREKFRSILGGRTLPSQDSSNARPTLVELMVAARLRERGAHIAFETTPDMIVTLRGRRYGLEVKRLSSAKNIKTRLADARHQLEKAQLPGIVAFDVDRLLRAGHPDATEVTLRLPADVQPKDLQWIAKNAFIDYLSDEVNKYAKPPVVAVITSAIVRTEQHVTNNLGTVFTYHVHPIASADEADLRPLAEFFGAGDRIRG
jgi:hypothetical protein